MVLEAELVGKEGIRSVSANICTGNILVIFAPDRSLDSIIGLLEAIVTAQVTSFETRERPKPQKPAAGIAELSSAWHTVCGFVQDLFQHRQELVPSEAQAPRPFAAAPPSGQASAQSEELIQAWHVLRSEEVSSILGTCTRRGLSQASAEERLAMYGPNVLPQPQPRSGLRIFLNQFVSLPVALLTASAILSIFTGGVADAAVIMLVVLLNASIGCATELQAEKTISALTRIGEPRTRVIREGQVREIEGSYIVVGDLLVLSRGDYVPADARLVAVQDLTVAESILTGESVPVSKTAEPLHELALPLGDRLNMVFRGTVVTGGSALAIVIAIGSSTEMGKIQALITQALRPQTPMERQLDVLGRQMVIIACVVCGAVLVIGVVRGFALVEMLKTSVSLAVAAIPEGLPTIATTTLAFGVWRLRKHNIVARHLDAIETLGAVEVLCLDKTGTITLNRMSVVRVFAGTQHLQLTGQTLAPGGDCPKLPELLHLARAAALCNDAELVEENGAQVVKGSPTEGALLEMALKCGIDVKELRRRFPTLRTEQRTETAAFMSRLHDAGGGRRLLTVKGSPSEVLLRCRWYMDGTRRFRLTEKKRSLIEAENERMAADALRVLGVARLGAKGREPTVEDGLTWLGLVGIADPPREGMQELIRDLHQAGIATKIITGDQRATAYAIGKSLGLSRRGRALQVVDSSVLQGNDGNSVNSDIAEAHIFSRVSPSHKLQIVQAIQRTGRVVAMTGDGINDGPALKVADVGVAMGKAGAETAREVADVVLLDDDIRAMVEAIREGRTIYDDIKKAVHYITATNLSEILAVLGCVSGGLGQPLTPRQLLWINVLTDVFPCLALAVEPAQADVMQRAPRDPRAPWISRAEYMRLGRESAIITGAGIASYLYGVSRYGIGPQAQTIAFLGLTTAQLLHTFSARSRRHTMFHSELPPNKYIPLAFGGGLALEVLAVLLPPLRSLLGLFPIGVVDALVCVASAAISLLANETIKLTTTARPELESLPEPAAVPALGPQPVAA